MASQQEGNITPTDEGVDTSQPDYNEIVDGMSAQMHDESDSKVIGEKVDEATDEKTDEAVVEKQQEEAPVHEPKAEVKKDTCPTPLRFTIMLYPDDEDEE